MRRNFILLVFMFALSAGCSTLNESWAPGEMKTPKASVKIVSVSVEGTVERKSIEKEISDLLPLFLSEESFVVVSSSGEADYSAEVKAREREYTDGWRTKRSVSAEIRLWKAGADCVLPLSAGRAVIQGNQSLSSSITLTVMLRRAVKKALEGFPRAGQEE